MITYAYFSLKRLETHFYRTECKDSNDIIFIDKTSRPCTFSIFNFSYHKIVQKFFSPKLFIFIFDGYHSKKENFFLLFKYIYFVRIQLNNERDINILVETMLKVMCIFNTLIVETLSIFKKKES